MWIFPPHIFQGWQRLATCWLLFDQVSCSGQHVLPDQMLHSSVDEAIPARHCLESAMRSSDSGSVFHLVALGTLCIFDAINSSYWILLTSPCERFQRYTVLSVCWFCNLWTSYLTVCIYNTASRLAAHLAVLQAFHLLCCQVILDQTFKK